MEKFGVRILEGYGVTETAPVLAMNTPIANTVRHRRPPVAADAGAARAGGRHRRGRPPVRARARTSCSATTAPRTRACWRRRPDGWHDTGDIVTIDAQGFITIKGRAKRFAKIGGEMVSLAAVEALASEIWPALPLVVVSPAGCAQGRAASC